MRHALARAFEDAAGREREPCPACRGPVPWVEHHRSLERSPAGTWLELSARFDPRTRISIDHALCPECGQSVGPTGRGIAQPARDFDAGARIVIVPGGFGNVEVDREHWAGFLLAWLETHGRGDLAVAASLAWEGSDGGLELWEPRGEPTREVWLRGEVRVRVAAMGTPEVTAAVVGWAEDRCVNRT